MSEPLTPGAVLHHAPFSLFNGDLLNRAFNLIHLRSRSAWHIAARCGVLILITWILMAAMAAGQGLYSTKVEARNFFADYAAYAQFLIALPLFLIAERIVERNTREAARDFITSGAIRPRDFLRVGPVHELVRRRRLALGPEYVLIAAAFGLSFFTIGPEIIGKGPKLTWHTGNNGTQMFLLPGGLTLAGAWAMFIALPVLNYIWLRLAWKIVIWMTYLRRISRFHLRLVASHPDLTGGIGFVSAVQAKWALVIFAYGVSNVAAVIAYKVGIEHASLKLVPVWAPAVLFVIFAPALFTIPLLWFTKQLFRAKRRALSAYRGHARQHAISFESRWFTEPGPDRARMEEVAELNQMATAVNRIEQMRVVPFDLRSFGQLVGSTIGSIATALPILKLEATLKDWLELFSKVLGG